MRARFARSRDAQEHRGENAAPHAALELDGGARSRAVNRSWHEIWHQRRMDKRWPGLSRRPRCEGPVYSCKHTTCSESGAREALNMYAIMYKYRYPSALRSRTLFLFRGASSSHR